jgi:hypothetical protein
MITATPSPTGRGRIAATAVSIVTAGLAAGLAASLASCKATPFVAPTGPSAGPEPRGVPEPPPTASVVPSIPSPPTDPLGLPTPPPGSRTSDRGDRRARPTPIGQLAPEEPPAVTPR